MGRVTNFKVVEDQKQTEGSSKELKGEAKKRFLYENYPDLYKKMYPDEVIEEKPKKESKNKPERTNKDLQKTNKTFVKNKYGSYDLQGGDKFGYKLKITTDMDF